MRYVLAKDRNKVRGLESCGNISASGSVLGMQRLYGWPRAGQVRIGAWIYNVGPGEVQRLHAAGLLRGVRQ